MEAGLCADCIDLLMECGHFTLDAAPNKTGEEDRHIAGPCEGIRHKDTQTKSFLAPECVPEARRATTKGEEYMEAAPRDPLGPWVVCPKCNTRAAFIRDGINVCVYCESAKAVTVNLSVTVSREGLALLKALAKAVTACEREE